MADDRTKALQATNGVAQVIATLTTAMPWTQVGIGYFSRALRRWSTATGYERFA